MEFISDEVDVKHEPGSQGEGDHQVPPPWQFLANQEFAIKQETVENVPSEKEYEMNIKAETTQISGNLASFDPPSSSTVHHVDLDLSDIFLIKKTIKVEPTDMDMNFDDPLALPELKTSTVESGIEPLRIKAYECDVCGKLFAYKSLIIRHKLSHTKEKPHTCEICGKKLASISSLNVHKKGHAGVKPHSCSVCGKAFARISDLTRHKKKIHTEVFWCEVCGKNFASTLYLKRHELVHNSLTKLAFILPKQ